LRLWADALCINQADVEERNRQVQQMGAIYAAAHHTVIYLGSSTPEIDFAFEALQLYQRGKLLRNRKKCLENSSPEEARNIWNMLKSDVLVRPWFNRVWVFQELVLSRDPWLQCGGRRVRWDDFCAISSAIGKQFVHSTSHTPGPISIDETPELQLLQPLQEMQASRHRFHYTTKSDDYNGSENSLLDLLSLRRGLGASDARDLVFAHLGVASDYRKDPKTFSVNYKLSIPQVFAEAARYIIEQRDGLDKVIEQISDVEVSDWLLDLPSWAPDWTIAKARKSSTIWSNHSNTNRPKEVPSFTPWVQIPMRLILRGWRVGALARLSDTLSCTEYSPGEISKAWIDVFDRNRRAIFEDLYNELLQTIGLDLHCRRAFPSVRMEQVDMGWVNYYGPSEFKVLDAIEVDNGSKCGLHPLALMSLMVLGLHDLAKPNPRGLEEPEVDLSRLTQGAQVLNGHRLGLLDSHLQYSRPSFGLFPSSVKKGDRICAFPGFPKMYVCRPVEKHRDEDDGNHFIFIGECYIDNRTYAHFLPWGLEESPLNDFIFH
jgi:hypothetical protein